MAFNSGSLLASAKYNYERLKIDLLQKNPRSGGYGSHTTYRIGRVHWYPVIIVYTALLEGCSDIL
jgi:hypothetical protein